MFAIFKYVVGAMLCRLNLHRWQARNESIETLPGDESPDRITAIACARCDEPHPVRWHLTQSDGPVSYTFPRPVSEAKALEYLAAHYAGAQVDYIDREWHVIFYRVPKKTL
jgi:hypothetical protein